MTSNEQQAAPRWVVGLDMEPTGAGAVEFSKWVFDTFAGPGRPRVVGIHVLENEYLYPMLRRHDLDEVVRWARASVVEDIDDSNAARVFAGLHVVQGRGAEQGLADACRVQHAQALVVSRHAPRKGRHIVRLGRVPRRLLRRIAVPTFVVPSDLTAESVGTGPVVAAVDLSDACLAAARYARRLAERLGRPLALAHVRATTEHYGVRYVPAETLAALQAEEAADGQHALARWAAEHGLQSAKLHSLSGSVVDQLGDLARGTDACLLAVGANVVPMWERVVTGSVGSEVSATAPCSVVNVPPTFGVKRWR